MLYFESLLSRLDFMPLKLRRLFVIMSLVFIVFSFGYRPQAHHQLKVETGEKQIRVLLTATQESTPFPCCSLHHPTLNLQHSNHNMFLIFDRERIQRGLTLLPSLPLKDNISSPTPLNFPHGSHRSKVPADHLDLTPISTMMRTTTITKRITMISIFRFFF